MEHNPERNPDPGSDSIVADHVAELKQTLDSRVQAEPKAENKGGGDAPGGVQGSTPRKGSPRPTNWRKEPITNFKLDGAGRVRMRSNGQPVRRGGSPRKPVHGDKLADGTTFLDPAEAGDPTASRVWMGEAADVADPVSTGTPFLGPEFGDVLADTSFNFFEAMFGPDWKPNESERGGFRRALSAVFNGVAVSATFAALLILGGYLMARAIKGLRRRRQAINAQPKTQPEAEADESRGDRRSKPERQNGLVPLARVSVGL